MARFRYSMQSILDMKLKMETQAKQEFASARAALDEEEDKLQKLRDRKAAYEAEAVGLLDGEGTEGKNLLNLQAIRESKEAIMVLSEYIEGQLLRVAAAEKTLEKAREKLTEVMQERKMHEKLKEKALQQFFLDEKRSEGKEVDELTSYTYGQRSRQENKAEKTD